MEAARFFCRLPHQDRLEVAVLTVVSLPDVPLTASTDLWYSKFLAGQKEHDKQVYADVEALFEGANASLHHLSKQGHAGHTIVISAEEMKADLIVVGSKGQSSLDRILLGSVSDYVATHASTSVLVVRPQLNHREHDARLRLTIAYDGSDNSQKAVDQFSKFSWLRNADVDVMSVVPMHRMIQHGLLPVAFEDSNVTVSEVTRATELAAVQFQRRQIHATATVVEAEHIGERIVAETDHRKPDLIVVGSRGRSGIARVLLGSVSQYVLRHSQHSVWIVRIPESE
jgi:nucleotide-binding universal stress UspA family protein